MLENPFFAAWLQTSRPTCYPAPQEEPPPSFPPSNMPDLLSIATLLKTAGFAVAKGAGTAIGQGAVRTWLRSTRTARAAARAVAAAAERHPFPGADRALDAWRKSASFENLLLRARLGQTDTLTEADVARSFADNAGGLGWGAATDDRALALTQTFLNALFDELAEGPEGHALAHRLAEAREAGAKGERADIQATTSATLAATLAVGGDVGEMRKMIEQLVAEGGLPPAYADALHQPAFDELTRLLTDGDAGAALDLADRYTASLDAAIAQEGDPTGHHADALRGYRQRLLFAGANAASWLMQADEAAARARRAFALGPVHPDRYPQAVQAAFNATLPDELRQLVTQMDAGVPERPRAQALLCFLDGDWDAAAEQLDALADPTLGGIRAEVEVARVDPADPAAVRTAAALLDREEDPDALPSDALALARMSVRLLVRVLDGHTPLAFDRRPLVVAVRRRVEAALTATPPDTRLRAHAVAALGDAARALLDPALRTRFGARLADLPEPVRSHVFVDLGTPPAATAVEAERAAGRLDDVSGALLTARIQRADNELAGAEKTLRETLFKTPDEADRTPVLAALLDVLRQAGRDDGGLLDQVPIPDADRWLLRQRDGAPLDLDAAAAFPLDVMVLRYVVSRLMTETEPREGEQTMGNANPDDPERPSTWTRRLVAVLPSQASWVSHAEALIHDANHDSAIDVLSNVGADYAERSVELEARARHGQGQVEEAARVLTAAAADFPRSVSIAVNASATLLSLEHADEAVDLLAPRVTDETESVGLLVNLATALLYQTPGDAEAASQAFGLLRRAYDLAPSQQLAMQVWMAARAARRDREAAAHFQAMTAGAAHVDIQTREDAERALLDRDGSGFTAFTGDFKLFAEVMAERMAEEKEAATALDEISTSHGLAYVDTFRASGRAWQLWTGWTEDAAQRGEAGGYSVLTDWPSSVFMFGRRGPAPAGVYADPSALLTLGVLGPYTAAAVVKGASPVHVARGTLDELQEELARLRQDVALAGYPGEAEAIERFQDTGAVVPYDADVEAAAPDNPGLGAARVDIGVAQHLGGRYVSDLDAVSDDARITSASLLATLNAEGLVEKGVADQAAQAHPDAFAGWETAPALAELPNALVFDRFAVSTWTASGLIGAVEGAVRIGPWAWTQIASDTTSRTVAALAYERLKNTVAVLRDAAAAGDIVEVNPVDVEHADGEGAETGEDAERGLEGLWEGALRSVLTARAHGLRLWADDRFYPLLLWMGGPTIGGPQTEALRASLLDGADEVVPTPTVDLVARLAWDGAVPEAEARRIAGELFDRGYRPAHPLVLADAIERYTLAADGPLRGRFLAIARSISEVPNYLPETTISPVRRQGFSRVAGAEIAEHLITTVWTHPDLSDDQRRFLADAFLNAVETLFHEQSPDPEGSRSDRTRLLFWRSLSSTLFTTPFKGQGGPERQDAALRWLGDAAARRPDPHADIVRLLEDNVSSAVALTPSVENIEAALSPDDAVDVAQVRIDSVGRFAFRALVPIVGSDLVDRLDPLLRRTVGMLARLDRRGCIDTIYGFDHDGKELTVMIPGEDDDKAAVGLLRRVLAGDGTLASSVHPTHLSFVYKRRPPQDWIDGGVPPDAAYPIRVDRPLFVLLWGDDRDIHPFIASQLVAHLSHIDPPLALLLLDVVDDLLGDGEDKVARAKDTLALALMESGYYELQRDLGHAVWRLRDWPADRLSRFLGWLGANDVQRLVSVDPSVGQHLVALENAVTSQSHFAGRQLLTDTFDDTAAVVTAVTASGPGAQDPPIADLSAWLVNRIEIAETSDDPFMAARSLRHVLLAWDVLGPALPGTADLPDRVQRYLGTALSDPDPAADVLAHHVALRRRLTRASIRLATFVGQGSAHVEACNAEDDALAQWLDNVWLLTSRLIEALPGLHGGLEEAADEAERATMDLGLDMLSAVVQDAFDPFALAGPEDVGRVLTLYAMSTSLPAVAARPGWWSSIVEERLEEIAAQSRPTHQLPTDNLADRFGVGTPLREPDLARSILDEVRGVTSAESADV